MHFQKKSKLKRFFFKYKPVNMNCQVIHKVLNIIQTKSSNHKII